MSKKTDPTPMVIIDKYPRPATPAEISYHVKTDDSYWAKFISLFLVDLKPNLHMHIFGSEWHFSFCVSEDAAPAVERFLATIPTARPSSDEILAAHLYAGADAGRLDLAQSGHSVAQVASQGDTQYLADLWNAFAPGSQMDMAAVDPDIIPVPPVSASVDETKLPISISVLA